MGSRCPICDEFTTVSDIMGRPHRCLPAFMARPDNDDDDHYYDDDDASKIHATDAEEAAEKFSAEWDTDGASFGAGSFELDVVVWPVANPDRRERFRVTGEVEIIYKAEGLD